jgi:hypothetical protein
MVGRNWKNFERMIILIDEGYKKRYNKWYNKKIKNEIDTWSSLLKMSKISSFDNHFNMEYITKFWLIRMSKLKEL